MNPMILGVRCFTLTLAFYSQNLTQTEGKMRSGANKPSFQLVICKSLFGESMNYNISKVELISKSVSTLSIRHKSLFESWE